MTLKKRLLVLLLVPFLLGGCGVWQDIFSDGGPRLSPDDRIEGFEDAIDVIMECATAEFLGYCPIDENFLFYLGNNFDERCLCDVASYAKDQDPEIWYAAFGKSIRVLWWEYCRERGIACEDGELVHMADCAKVNETVLDFCGDLQLADGMATTSYMEKQPNGLVDCFSEALLAEMRDADIFVVNNEFTFSERGVPLPRKTYTFRAKPTYVKYLSAIGADLVTLANNHVYDYGDAALVDTLDIVEKEGILRIGAGRNLAEAMRPVYYIANGKKIAIVNATQIERTFPFTMEAGEHTAGVLKTLHSERFCSVIARAKRNADYCIVSVHWGTEYKPHYGEDQEQLAKDFVSAGADVIVGGHTHCLEGIEFVGNVPVYYSLGNYFFSLDGNMPETYNTGLARIRIKNDGQIRYEFVPCRFKDGVVKELTDEKQARALFDYMEAISDTTVIADDGTITRK